MELDEPRASMRLQRTERGGEGREQWRTARAPVERPRGGSARGMWPAAAELAMVTNEAMRSNWIQMILKFQTTAPVHVTVRLVRNRGASGTECNYFHIVYHTYLQVAVYSI